MIDQQTRDWWRLESWMMIGGDRSSRLDECSGNKDAVFLYLLIRNSTYWHFRRCLSYLGRSWWCKVQSVGLSTGDVWMGNINIILVYNVNELVKTGTIKLYASCQSCQSHPVKSQDQKIGSTFCLPWNMKHLLFRLYC